MTEPEAEETPTLQGPETEEEAEGGPEEASEEPEGEETQYCIECDREVDEDDIAGCDNPRCPFRAQEASAEEQQPAVEGETAEEKHFVMMDIGDHGDHRRQLLPLRNMRE